MIEGEHPAVAFDGWGFKVKFARSELQGELVVPAVNDLSNIGLCWLDYDITLDIYNDYQLNNSMRNFSLALDL